MHQLKFVGIDLAKSVFQIANQDQRGKITFNRKLSRAKLIEWLQKSPACEVIMESCGTSNYWARLAQRYGHQARQLPANAVRPFRRGNKNDANDAVAIIEAAKRPDILDVPIKSVAQIGLQAVHNIRQRLIGNRTQLLNQIRALCAEHGLITRKSPGALLAASTGCRGRHRYRDRCRHWPW